MSVTIKDVAKAAGVSVATVSRVLNGSSSVSQAAADRVNKAINEMHYSPNSLGRNLRKCETNRILVIQPSSDHSLYAKIIAGMQEEAAKVGYDIVTAISNSVSEAENRQLNMLYNKTVDGAVLLGTTFDCDTINRLAENYSIALCCESLSGADVLTVVVDDEAGGHDATAALIQKGHRKIALITAEGAALSSNEREQGYLRALREGGIEPREEYIYRGDYEYENAAIALHRFMSLDDKPTAIFAVSDNLAAGVIREAASMGIKVGEELAVIGFDDITWCARFVPSISSVAQPCAEMGKLVAQKLISNITGESNDNDLYTLAPTVMLRESTGVSN